MLTTIEKVIFLQEIDIFEKIPSEDLAHIALVTEEITVEPDCVIYKEGVISDSMYLVLDGKISLRRQGLEVMIAGSRDVFGTWALFDDETRVVTATTLEESRLLKIDKESFLDLLTDHSKITEGVLKAMVSRLRGLIGRAGGA
jgi:CRP-like cAMP-binding protein